MSTPRNILLTNSSDIYGGGEFYVLELAKELRARGNSIWVVCKPNNLLHEKCESAHIPTIPLDFPPQGQFVKFIRWLRKITRKNHIDIVHTNSNYDRTAGGFAARMAGVRHVTNVHSFHSLQHNLTHWVRNHAATDHFIVDGYCVKEMLIQEDRLDASKISVVYLGVDPSEMKRDETMRKKIRAEFTCPDDQIVIGNVARMVPFKGHEYLLKAFAELAKHSPGMRLVLVGDGELSENLSRLAHTLKIENQIIFAGFRDDLQALYSAFDIYVHPSIEGGGETFPFAILQALAQQLPVIVTRVGDVPAMVSDSINGFVVPDKDPSALAVRLGILLHNESLRSTMGTKSRALLLERFTVSGMVDRVEEVYSRVLDGRKRSDSR